MATAQTETKTDRKERGTGPMQLFYVDSKGANEHKRLPLDATGIKVVAAGKSHTFSIKELPAAIKEALVVDALSKRVKTYVANHAEDNGSNVAELAKHVYDEMVAGRIYSKTEGTGQRGKKFDASLYAEALRATYAFMAKKNLKNKAGKAIVALNDGQVGDFKMQLEAMTPKERTEKIKGLQTNSIYKKALAELKMRAIEVDTEVMEDMPF